MKRRDSEIEPMDILMAPTHDDVILVKITKWIKHAYPNNDGIATVLFKKDTPKEILTLFEKNINLFSKRLYYTITKKYQVEK